MKTLPLVLGLIAAGVVGALAASFVGRDGGASPGGPAGAPRDDARLLELTRTVELLTDRVEALEKAPPVVAATPAPAGEPAALVPSAPEDSTAASAGTEKKIEEKVKAAVAEARQKEMEAMGRRMGERFAQRENAMVARFAEENGLNDYQREQVEKILAKRREAAGKYFRTLFRPSGDEKVDVAKLQEEYDAARKAADEELKSLLAVDQYEAFRKLESQRRGRGFMGGGGRPR